MVQKTAFSLLLFLFLLASCQQPDEKVEIITFHPSDYDVILFNYESRTSMEEVYLDAIIELKAKYPAEFNQVSSEAKSTRDIAVNHDENPTLLITKNGHTVKELSGAIPKKEILKHLEMTMEE